MFDFLSVADGLLSHLAHWDTTAFLFLNGLHSPLLDPLMRQVSSLGVLVPVHLLVLAAIFRRRKWRSRGLLLALLVLVIAVDLAGANCIKALAQRLRPSHEEALTGLIHLIDGRRGGTYGFASTHTAYAFALAGYAWLRLRHRRLTILVFAWAAFVGYSRIYAGLHYPGDVVAGAGWGLIVAFAAQWARTRMDHFSLAAPLPRSPRPTATAAPTASTA